MIHCTSHLTVCVRVMRCLLLLCVITVVLARSTAQLHAQWRLWKERHGKVYANEANENARRSIWEKNYRLVERHNRNSSKHGFSLALNQFADLVSCIIRESVDSL